MHYTWFEIENFKSFARARFEFDPGLNLIVGRNSSGKSALLQALSLQGGNDPHRSLESLPTTTHVPSPNSSLRFEFGVPSVELDAILQGPIPQFSIPLPPNYPQEAQACEKLLTKARGAPILRFSGRQDRGQRQLPEPQPGWTLYPTAGQQAPHAAFTRRADRSIGFAGGAGCDGNRLDYQLASVLQQRVFYFQAERLKISQHHYGPRQDLSPDASNLPQVLGALVADPVRFSDYNQLVSRVLPEIQAITARPVADGMVEIAVWEHSPATRRMDLAMPLSACGTGVSQVLAMLYVLATADSGRVLVIDEPNSFLHPGAMRALLEIFREHPQHQYIISTHSPQVISDAGPVRVYLLRKGSSTTVELLDPSRAADAKEILVGVGARLSDVFGAERVIWVEGATEEQCFKSICAGLRIPMKGAVIAAVLHTGDFDGHKADATLRIYRRLSGAPSLVPPALAFVFDREKRTHTEMADLIRESQRAVQFLARRMYENYLLDADAVAAVLNGLEALRNSPVDAAKVQEALDAAIRNPKNHPRGRVDGNVTVHGAKVLAAVFSDLTQARHEYVKTKHAEELTTWLVRNKPEALTEIADLLKGILGRGEED